MIIDQRRAASQRPRGRWKICLILLGIALTIAAVGTELVILFADFDKVVTTDGTVVTTTTKGSTPAGGLVTGALGLAIACILAAYFGERITKVSVAGIEFELTPVTGAKLGEQTRLLTKEDPQLFTTVYVQAADMLKRDLLSTGRRASLLDDSPIDIENAAIAEAVQQAARQSGLADS